MIKILHIVSSLEYGGGVQSMLYNYYTNLNRADICFDFIVHGNKKGEYEELFEKMGSTIIHITPKKKSLIKNLMGINYAMSIKKYDIVHSHQNLLSGVSLMLAKINNVPIRISHSHSYKKNTSLLQTIKELPLRFLNNTFSNYKFACESNAGKWLFGHGWEENENNLIMYNAIDTKKFYYNPEVRDEYRKSLGLYNRFIILQIGRLSNEKNQEFSIEVLKELSSLDSNVVLLIVGEGNDEEKLKSIVQRNGLDYFVKFLGVRKDVPELMNAADLLLLPSKNEGLGMVAIEAQACGLKVLASDNVPKATYLTNLIEYCPIDNTNAWKTKIINSNLYDRKKEIKNTKFNNYSIQIQAKKYEEWIKNKAKKRMN